MVAPLAAAVRKRRRAIPIVLVLLVMVVAGVFMWRAKATSPTFIEPERAACAKKCSPLSAELVTTRQERVYQMLGWRNPVPQYPVCKCV